MRVRRKKAIKNYTQEDLKEDFADASYMKVTGELPELLKKEKKEVSVKKVVSILKMSTGGSLLNTLGVNNTGSSFSPGKPEQPACFDHSESKRYKKCKRSR